MLVRDLRVSRVRLGEGSGVWINSREMCRFGASKKRRRCDSAFHCTIAVHGLFKKDRFVILQEVQWNKEKDVERLFEHLFGRFKYFSKFLPSISAQKIRRQQVNS